VRPGARRLQRSGPRLRPAFPHQRGLLNVSKGPFLSASRQAISGESDTIALLDANNPFNQTLAIPGVFQDIDEARIPLWTVRGTYNLFNSWGPISSAFAEAYLVPGSIDTTVSPLPLPKASPYSPPQDDPQSLIAGLIPPDINGALVKPLLGHIQVSLYDHLPTRSMSNSRFGFRLGGVVARDYTTSVWYYRTFANPVPRFLPLDLSRAPLVNPKGKGPTQLITEIQNQLVDVIGGAVSFFSQPLNGIVRTEMEFFLNEPAFIRTSTSHSGGSCTKLRLALKALGQSVGRKTERIRRHHSFRLGYHRFFFASSTRRTASSGSGVRRTVEPERYVHQRELSIRWTAEAQEGGRRHPGRRQHRRAHGPDHRKAAHRAVGLRGPAPLRVVRADALPDRLHARTSHAIRHGRHGSGRHVLRPGRADVSLHRLAALRLQVHLHGRGVHVPDGYFRDRSQLSARVTFLLN
jgi:hypothetical protein